MEQTPDLIPANMTEQDRTPLQSANSKEFVPTSGLEPCHQRVLASAAASFKHDEHRTRLNTLYQQGSAKLRFPKTFSPSLEAVLINTAGGLTGGDRLNWDLNLKERASVIATTQACEKSYKSTTGSAFVNTTVRMEADSCLHWLPQETILYDRSDLSRRLEFHMDESATLLAIEIVVIGREAMGETVSELSFQDRWRVRVGSKMVFADDLSLKGPSQSLAQLGEHRAVCSILYVSPGPAETISKVAMELRKICPTPMSGFSAVGQRLTGRILARDSYELRKSIAPVLATLCGAELPKVWRI